VVLARPPEPALRPFVRQIWAADAPAAVPPPGGRERVLPGGTTHVAIRLTGGPLRLFRGADDSVGTDVGWAVVGGARAAFYVRDVSRPACSVGAELEPGAAAALLGAAADELAGRHTPLDDLWGRGAAEARERLLEAPDLAARLDGFEALLAARLPKVKGVHPAVAHALGRFHQGADVARVAAEAGYSERRMFELFRAAVGLAPKAYCRVRRFNAALAHLLASPGGGCAAAAAAAGYSDQAHMAREFRELAGVSPSTYRALAPPSARHVPLPNVAR
jgi:AraC-like DNA-binding protein